MDTDEFDELSSRAPEYVSLEFIAGRLGVKPARDGDHAETVRWLAEHCLEQRPDLWLYQARGLAVETDHSGRARPDGALAPSGVFAGQGEWAESDSVLMVSEVTSHDDVANERDRVEKPVAYAQAGIPVYLLIDRDSGKATVFSEPTNGAYDTSLTVAFGHTVTLPGLDITLDTEGLKEYVR